MEVSVLGPLEVTDQGRPIALGRKESTVLARLVAARGRIVSDDALIEAVWSLPPPSARKTLHGYVHRLRRAMGAGAVVRHASGYSVGDLSTDVDLLGTALERARSLVADGRPDDAAREFRRASAMFRGSPLPELDDDLTVAGLRRQLEEIEFGLTEELARVEIERGCAADIIGDLEELVARDPVRESAWFLLAEACADVGRSSDGLDVVSRARRALAVEVGLELGPQFDELEQAILHHRRPGVRERSRRTWLAAKAPDGASARIGNMPYRRARLVGREQDIDRFVVAVSESSIVTLRGPAGVGKTTVALAVANHPAMAHFGDGRWLVELASASASDEIWSMVAASLGLQLSSTHTASSLATALDRQHRLVVLDNCEHVVECVRGFVEEVERRCPKITILTTSREELGCVGERVMQVSPLGLDASGGQSDAACLFIERTALMVDDFQPDEEDRTTIDEICQRLDGLPLAIELAAARVPVFGLAGVLERLERSIDVLSRRHAPDARHSSLRSALAWSCDSLSPTEARTFERMSVFRGGFDSMAAAAVCDAGGANATVDDDLSSLVSRSLISVVPFGRSVRFSVLEPVRQFAAESLLARGHADSVLARHAGHFASWSNQAASGVRGNDEMTWHRRYVAEWSNLREALNHLIACGDADGACRLVSDVSLWAKERMMLEVGEWAERVLAMPSASEVPHSAIVAATASVVARTTGRVGEADAWFREAHDRYSRLGSVEQPWLIHASSFQVAFGDHDWHESAAAEQRDVFGHDFTWWAEFEIFDLLPPLTEVAISDIMDARSESVLERFDNLRGLAAELGHATLIARVDAWYGSALRTLEPERALDLLEPALKTAEEYDARRLVYQIDMDLGPLYATLGRPSDALHHLRPRIERFMRAGAIEQARSDAVAALPALVALGCHELAAVAVGHLHRHFASRWIQYLVGHDLERVVRDALGGPAMDRYRRSGEGLDASIVVAQIVAAMDTLTS